MHVVDNLDLGGAQSVVVAFADAVRTLPDVHVEVTSLATPSVSPASEQLAGLSVPVHHLPPTRARELMDGRALRLRRLLLQGHFDVVHAHLDYAMVLTALATPGSGLGHVLTLHNTVSELWDLGGARRHLSRWAARRADVVLACGERVREESPLAGQADAVTVLANPAPVVGRAHDADPTSARREIGGDPAALAVITVSRLAASKHIDRVVDAVVGLRGRGVAVELAVIGDGPERLELERRAAGTDGVRFLGRRNDVAHLMAGADVLVCPYGRNEGMPMSVLEAMVAGVVVVGSPSGDMAAVLADGRGVVIDPPVVPAIENALARLAADPDERLEIAEEASAWVERERSVRAWAERTVAYYETAVGGHRRARRAGRHRRVVGGGR